MAKIRKQWIQDLIDPDSRLVNGSNCDDLHFHTEIKDDTKRNILKSESSAILYQRDDVIFTEIHPQYIKYSQDYYIYKFPDLGAYLLPKYAIAFNQQDKYVYINDPTYSHSSQYVSLFEFRYFSDYNESSVPAGTIRYYRFGSPDGLAGIYFSFPVVLTGIDLSISSYTPRIRRKYIEIRRDNAIVTTWEPSITDLEMLKAHIDLNITYQKQNFNLSIYRYSDNTYDRWGYVVISVSFRRCVPTLL